MMCVVCYGAAMLRGQVPVPVLKINVLHTYFLILF